MTLIQGGETSLSEINEVNNLLAKSVYDRDQITGTRSYTNYTYNSWESAANSSANESTGLDRGDFITNTINVGQVVYRGGVRIDGTIGYTNGSTRDSDDFFRFDVGKAGRINISLTGLSNNAGLALYSASGSWLQSTDKSSNQSESINLDLQGLIVFECHQLTLDV